MQGKRLAKMQRGINIVKIGGKVVKAISNNVDFLINNDITSTSSKNTKAKELGIKIISEDDLLKMSE